MAVSVATGAMGSLIAKLTALTLSDRRLGSSDEEEEHVREEMVLLKDELSSVSATLEKLAHRGEEEGYMNMWTREVREMSYDMEDFIDQNMFTVAGLHDHVYSNPAGFLRKTAGLIRKPWSRNRIAHQMRQFKARLVEATEQRDRFRPRSESLDLHLDQALAIDPRLPALSATELVGMDVPRDMLIKLLTDEHQQLRVVSVMGMGGLGKTTLACEVYRNIKDRFHCGAFLHASQKPDIKKILRDILRQVGLAEEYANEEDWDELPLVHTVREYLCDKRCWWTDKLSTLQEVMLSSQNRFGKYKILGLQKQQPFLLKQEHGSRIKNTVVLHMLGCIINLLHPPGNSSLFFVLRSNVLCSKSCIFDHVLTRHPI